MVGVGKSNVGMLRPRNEDSILVSNEAIGVLPNVFVVADGMGGHKAGNVASASAIEGFIEFVKKPENESEEVLDVMRDLAKEGMTMLIVTHEMGFARNVGNRILFMDNGEIIEDCSPKNFFENPTNERIKDFLNKVLNK